VKQRRSKKKRNNLERHASSIKTRFRQSGFFDSRVTMSVHAKVVTMDRKISRFCPKSGDFGFRYLTRFACTLRWCARKGCHDGSQNLPILPEVGRLRIPLPDKVCVHTTMKSIAAIPALRYNNFRVMNYITSDFINNATVPPPNPLQLARFSIPSRAPDVLRRPRPKHFTMKSCSIESLSACTITICTPNIMSLQYSPPAFCSVMI